MTICPYCHLDHEAICCTSIGHVAYKLNGYTPLDLEDYIMVTQGLDILSRVQRSSTPPIKDLIASSRLQGVPLGICEFLQGFGGLSYDWVAGQTAWLDQCSPCPFNV